MKGSIWLNGGMFRWNIEASDAFGEFAMTMNHHVKRRAILVFAMVAMGVPVQPAYADDPMVINGSDGSMFMEEVAPPPSQKKAPEKPKPVVDLSTLGVPVDQQGRIVPLIDRSSPVQQQYSRTTTYNEPWYNFLPQQYVNPYGYRFNALGQTVDAFGRPVTATGQALYPNSMSPGLNAYLPPVGVRPSWIAPNGMPSGVPLMNAPGTSPNSNFPQPITTGIPGFYGGYPGFYGGGYPGFGGYPGIGGYPAGLSAYGYSPYGSIATSPYGLGTNVGINLGKNFQLNLGTVGTPYVPNGLFGNPAAGFYPGGGLFGGIRQFESTSTVTPLFP